MLPGGPEDIYRTEARVKALFGDNAKLHRWLDMARADLVADLPARTCWLGRGARHLAGLAINEMVASGELRAFGGNRGRSPRRALVVSPNCATEGMRDGSDAGRRLAASDRAGEHRERRDLGQPA